MDTSKFTKGVDVAHFDGQIDWGKVLAAGIGFGICKATEGLYYTDSRFAYNWQQLGQCGLSRGAYHFYRCDQDPIEQAKHFLTVVHHTPHDIAPTLDLEEGGVHGASRAAIIEGAARWIEYVQNATGRRVIVYVNPDFALNRLDGKHFAANPLWLAQYAAAPHVPKPWQDWALWQYAAGEIGQHAVPGIPTSVDVNWFPGNHSDLVARLITGSVLQPAHVGG